MEGISIMAEGQEIADVRVSEREVMPMVINTIVINVHNKQTAVTPLAKNVQVIKIIIKKIGRITRDRKINKTPTQTDFEFVLKTGGG